jgi:uncharacterized coiled-coil protein SlyX
MACVVVDDDGSLGRRSVVQFESRMSVVEDGLEEHSKMIGGLREAVVSLGERMGSLERRVDALEHRMDLGFARVDQRFDGLEARMARQFHWLVGILLTAMIAIIGVLGGITAAILNQ